MYRIKDKLYADAGYILQAGNYRAFAMEDRVGAEEESIDTDNIKIVGNFVMVDNIPIMLDKIDYGELKSKLVKFQYSYDDQIAIMLNKDDSEESLLRYEKMQAWREWAGSVAKDVMERAATQPN